MERIRRKSPPYSLAIAIAIATVALAGTTEAATLASTSSPTASARFCPAGRTCEGVVEMGQLVDAGSPNITGQYRCVGANCSVLLWNGSDRVGRAQVRVNPIARAVESTLTLENSRTFYRYRGTAARLSRTTTSIRAQLQLCSLATTEICTRDITLTYACRGDTGTCTPTTASVNGQTADPGQARSLFEATLQQTPLAALPFLTAGALLGTPTTEVPCGATGTMLIKGGCKGDCIKDACSLCRGRIVGAEDFVCHCDGNERCSECVTKIYWDCAGSCTPWTLLLDAAIKILGFL